MASKISRVHGNYGQANVTRSSLKATSFGTTFFNFMLLTIHLAKPDSSLRSPVSD
jgi:hypothetical protein